MTRGKMIIILNKAIIISCEFNGDMYPSGYGKQVFDQLKMIFNTEDLNEFVKYFNDKNFQYEEDYAKTYTESIEWFEKAKDMRNDYFDNWFSDWLYIKNLSCKPVTITDNSGKDIEIDQNQVYALNFGSDPDEDDKIYLGM